MSFQCGYCDELTIARLVALAKQECAGWEFPQRSFYQHHKSVQHLEESANAGCDLCSVILNRLQGTKHDAREGLWSDDWDGADCTLEESVFAAAKQRPLSEVKLAIARWSVEGSMLTRAARWETVRALDQLWVQVGPHDPNVDDGSEYSKLLPTVHLKITTLNQQSLLLDGLRIGRLGTDPDLAAESNFAIAKAWLQGCQTSHAQCLQGVIPHMPTRVIDVHPHKDTSTVCIIRTNGKRAHYVALSHCWGGPITPVLTTKNLDEFQKELLVQQLPANFRDAITITQKLGIKYLWVDSLCILQDSKKDWEQESKRMGTVYRDATVTLSAFASRGSKEGIIKNLAAPRTASRPVARLKLSADSDTTHTVQIQAEDIEDLRHLEASGPLAVRGWCLQESILSPRQLYYGRQQIYWRCPAGYAAADGTESGSSVPLMTFPNMSEHLYSDILRCPSRDLSKDASGLDDLLADYYELLTRYSRRRLTFGSDKLAAWSGIAQRFHSAIGGEYLAGLWSSDLAMGLLWGFSGDGHDHVPEYRAPSWSWAITDDHFQFLYNMLNIDLRREGSSVQLIEHHIVLRDPSNPYGEVRSANITLRGLTIPFKWNEAANGTDLDESVGSIHWDKLPPFAVSKEADADHLFIRGERTGLSYNLYISYEEGCLFLRTDADRSNQSPALMFLALIVQMDDRGVGDTKEHARGLLLTFVSDPPDGNSDMFRRVGTFIFRSDNSRYEKFKERTVNII